jgi:hypothetical protein
VHVTEVKMVKATKQKPAPAYSATKSNQIGSKLTKSSVLDEENIPKTLDFTVKTLSKGSVDLTDVPSTTKIKELTVLHNITDSDKNYDFIRYGAQHPTTSQFTILDNGRPLTSYYTAYLQKGWYLAQVEYHDLSNAPDSSNCSESKSVNLKKSSSNVENNTSNTSCCPQIVENQPLSFVDEAHSVLCIFSSFSLRYALKALVQISTADRAIMIGQEQLLLSDVTQIEPHNRSIPFIWVRLV